MCSSDLSGGTRDYFGEIRDAVGGKPDVKDLSSTNQPPPPSSFEEKVSQLLEQLVSGKGMNVDTSEEEALIRELMQDRTGQALVEQRARMGRAGFGASGALAAMEGDVRRQAAQQATQETLAMRRQAEQEAIDNALRSIGVDVSKRREARSERFDEEFMNALKSALGMETSAYDESGNRVGGSNAGLPEASGSQGAPTTDRQNPASSPTQQGSVYDLGSKAAVPSSASYWKTEAGYDIYVDPSGNQYRVPAGS